MKQTAVEWLKSQIELTVDGYFGSPWAEIFEKAKAMEKEQLIGLLEWINKISQQEPMRLETDHDDIVEQYLNETK